MKICPKHRAAKTHCGAGPAETQPPNRPAGLPAERLEKVLLQTTAPGLLAALAHVRVRECLERSPAVLNSLCGTTGLSAAECGVVLRSRQGLRRAVATIAPKPTTFRTGQSDMTQLTISEGFIFTASDDGTVHRFDAHGRRVCTFAGHSGGVWALGINGSTLITGSTDKMARIWNTSKGQALHVLRGHRATIRAVALLSGGRVATASREHTIVVWSFNGERLHLFAGHAQAVR